MRQIYKSKYPSIGGDYLNCPKCGAEISDTAEFCTECGEKIVGAGGEETSEIGGELPINPSGGAIGGNPPCATGLIRIIEAAKQLRGEADKYQVDNAKKAVASGQIGMCAQNNIIFVLEGGN